MIPFGRKLLSGLQVPGITDHAPLEATSEHYVCQRIRGLREGCVRPGKVYTCTNTYMEHSHASIKSTGKP